MMVEVEDCSPLLYDDESDTYKQFPEYRPRKRASLTSSGCCTNWIKTVLISTILSASILTLVPFFMGQKCPAIPSALPFAICIGVIGVLRAIVVGYINARSIIASGGMERAAFVQMKELPDEDGELFYGERNLHLIERCLAYIQLGKGTIWGLFIALSNTYLFNQNHPDTCQRGVSLMVFITPLITGPILLFVIMMRLRSHPMQLPPKLLEQLIVRDDDLPNDDSSHQEGGEDSNETPSSCNKRVDGQFMMVRSAPFKYFGI